jgi:hypothetical protein
VSIFQAQFHTALAEAQALVEEDGLDARQRNAALEAMAVVLLADRTRQSEARDILSQLYARDPEHRLNLRDTGPNVIAAFDRARESRPEAGVVEMENLTPDAMAQRGAPIVAIGLGEHADAVDELRLSYRQGEDVRYERVVMTSSRDGERPLARARIPAIDGPDAYEVEFFITAHAPSRAIIGRLGSSDEPLRVRVPAASEPERSGTLGILGVGGEEQVEGEESGILSKWWFWAIAGALVVGGVLAAVLVTSSGETAPDGTLGSGVLP